MPARLTGSGVLDHLDSSFSGGRTPFRDTPGGPSPTNETKKVGIPSALEALRGYETNERNEGRGPGCAWVVREATGHAAEGQDHAFASARWGAAAASTARAAGQIDFQILATSKRRSSSRATQLRFRGQGSTHACWSATRRRGPRTRAEVDVHPRPKQ